MSKVRPEGFRKLFKITQRVNSGTLSNILVPVFSPRTLLCCHLITIKVYILRIQQRNWGLGGLESKTNYTSGRKDNEITSVIVVTFFKDLSNYLYKMLLPIEWQGFKRIFWNSCIFIYCKPQTSLYKK